MTKPKDIWDDYPFVAHYTSQAGLEGILQTQSLHATHYRYLNDSSEIQEIRQPLIEAAAQRLIKPVQEFAAKSKKVKAKIEADGGLATTCAREAKIFVDTLFNVTFEAERDFSVTEPYIVSFCGHKTDHEHEDGLLSQWRAYGSGYAIIFETQKLCEMFGAEARKFFYSSAFFGDVVYGKDDKRFGAEFEELFTAIQAAVGSIFEGGQNLGNLYERFATGASRCKHRGFAEEREVRAVMSPIGVADVETFRVEHPDEFEKDKYRTPKDILFKAGMVPYIDLLTGSQLLPISKIIVGPHAQKEMRKSRLERYLRINRLQVPVHASATPFLLAFIRLI
ncbi:MAG: DUF2971 domain-containing protein [Hyphomicrobiaceae bacterium]|nr:DUF2971 domain-containing protein [Hyphomicrobiaceae bacterium]